MRCDHCPHQFPRKSLIHFTVKPRCDREVYQRLTGKLMWAMIATHPDINFVTSRLMQFNADPTENRWVAAKRVLPYLQGTKGTGIHYSKGDNDGLYGYSHSDFAEDNTRKSTSGHLFLLAGGAMAWASKKQSLVAS